jgi:hypothetical protein
MRYELHAAQAADRFRVVGELVQVHLVVGNFESSRECQPVGDVEFVLSVGLRGLRDKLLVEIRNRGVNPGERTGGGLETVDVG